MTCGSSLAYDARKTCVNRTREGQGINNKQNVHTRDKGPQVHEGYTRRTTIMAK